MDIARAILFRNRSELEMRHQVASDLVVGAGAVPAGAAVLFREPVPRHERDILTDGDAVGSQDSHAATLGELRRLGPKSVEVSGRRKVGSRVPLELSLSCAEPGNGTPACIVAFLRAA